MPDRLYVLPMFFSPLGKLANRALYFVDFFFIFLYLFLMVNFLTPVSKKLMD